MEQKIKFSFQISLNTLDHLGRNLYRSFATVLGEAISNSWDADANNVWIYIDKDKNSFCIKDDGSGMTGDDFQNKFLKVGYSKRKDGQTRSPKNRPYIGRKGIGKLALLSCAERITVLSKTEGNQYVGGTIDNRKLDKAIDKDLASGDYLLEELDISHLGKYTRNHDHGTIIYFEDIKRGIKNRLRFIKKIIALYFRFSLLEQTFRIFLNDEEITHTSLLDFAEKTEYLWEINKYEDPFIQAIKSSFSEENKKAFLETSIKISGFIASVERPSHLKIISTKQKIGVDLFVNGRLRESDILRNISSARIAENYLYGQIHYDSLDDGDDPFNTSRESVKEDNQEYIQLLEILEQEILPRILSDWDDWRRADRKDGDPENNTITHEERKAEELVNAVSKEYDLPRGAEKKKIVEGWQSEISQYAKHNMLSYAQCFVAENLLRKFIKSQKDSLSKKSENVILKYKKQEESSKFQGNISIAIRKDSSDLSYLDMMSLAKEVEHAAVLNELPNDAKQYKPIRDAIMHTAPLTKEAKEKLTAVYNNIKARIKTLISGDISKPRMFD